MLWGGQSRDSTYSHLGLRRTAFGDGRQHRALESQGESQGLSVPSSLNKESFVYLLPLRPVSLHHEGHRKFLFTAAVAYADMHRHTHTFALVRSVLLHLDLGLVLLHLLHNVLMIPFNCQFPGQAFAPPGE